MDHLVLCPVRFQMASVKGDPVNIHASGALRAMAGNKIPQSRKSFHGLNARERNMGAELA